MPVLDLEPTHPTRGTAPRAVLRALLTVGAGARPGELARLARLSVVETLDALYDLEQDGLAQPWAWASGDGDPPAAAVDRRVFAALTSIGGPAAASTLARVAEISEHELPTALVRLEGGGCARACAWAPTPTSRGHRAAA